MKFNPIQIIEKRTLDRGNRGGTGWLRAGNRLSQSTVAMVIYVFRRSLLRFIYFARLGLLCLCLPSGMWRRCRGWMMRGGVGLCAQAASAGRRLGPADLERGSTGSIGPLPVCAVSGL